MVACKPMTMNLPVAARLNQLQSPTQRQIAYDLPRRWQLLKNPHWEPFTQALRDPKAHKLASNP